MNDMKFFIIVGILGLACLVGISSYLPERFDKGTGVRMADFPQTVGNWTGKDIQLTKRDYDILETDNLIMREYTDPAGRSVLLYIIYSDNNRKVAHPPEVCYTGGGSTITEKGVFNVSPRIRANKMITDTAGSASQFVVYWFKAGDLNTGRYFEQQLKVAWLRTLGKTTSTAMIRISANLEEGKKDQVTAMIHEFSALIEPLLPKYVP